MKSGHPPSKSRADKLQFTYGVITVLLVICVGVPSLWLVAIVLVYNCRTLLIAYVMIFLPNVRLLIAISVLGIA
jgi:hypothetical protein